MNFLTFSLILVFQLFNLCIAGPFSQQTLLSSTLRGFCSSNTSPLIESNAYPYKFTYNDLGGTTVFSGLTDMTVAYWVKLDGLQIGVNGVNYNQVYNQYHFQWGNNSGSLTSNKAYQTTFEVFDYFYSSEPSSQINQTEVSGLYKTPQAQIFTNLFNPYDISKQPDKAWASYYLYYSSTQISATDQVSVVVTGVIADNSLNDPTYIFNVGSHMHVGGSYSLCGYLSNLKVFLNWAYDSQSSATDYFISQLRSSGYQTGYITFQQPRSMAQFSNILGDLSGFARYGVIQGVSYNNGLELQIGKGQYIAIKNYKINQHYYSYFQQYPYLDHYENSFAISYWINIQTQVTEAIVFAYNSYQNANLIKISHPKNINSTFDIQFYLNSNPPVLYNIGFSNNQWHKITVQFQTVPFYSGQTAIVFIDTTYFQDILISNTNQINSQNFDNATLYIGDSAPISPNNVGSFYSIKEFTIMIDPIILSDTLANQTSVGCAQTVLLNNEFSCLMCQTGYSLQPESNLCMLGISCPSNYSLNNNTNVCEMLCQTQCASCSLLNSSFCNVCSNNRINPPICSCPLYTFDNPQTGECLTTRMHQEFQFGEISATISNGLNSQTTATAWVDFKKGFSMQNFVLIFTYSISVPSISLWTVYVKMYNATTRQDFVIDVVANSITQYGFLYLIQQYNGTLIEKISIRYLATTDPGQFKLGTAEYNGSVLNSGATTRSVSQQCTIPNYPIYYNASIIAVIRDYFMSTQSGNVGPSCSILSQKINIQFQAQGSSLIQRLRCEYIVVPTHFFTQQFSKTFANSDYIKTQSNSNSNFYSWQTSFSLTNPVTYINGIYPVYGVQAYFIQNTITYPIIWNFNMLPKNSTTNLYQTIQVGQKNLLQSFQIQLFFPQELCNPICLQCNYFDGVQGTCQTCAPLNDSLRITVPPCNCILGAYEDYVTGICKLCNPQCYTCTFNYSQCVTCLTNSNRVLPDCACQSGTRNYLPYTQVCGDCTKSFPNITFASDWSNITIFFGYPVTIANVMSPQVNSQQNCQTLFSPQFIAKLGIDYVCRVTSDQNSIIVSIGQSATILPNDLIFFANNTVREPSCILFINYIVKNTMNYAGSFPTVQVTLDGPQGIQSLCSPITIYVSTITNDRGRGIYSQIWNLISIMPTDTNLSITLNTALAAASAIRANSFTIPPNTLNPNTVYTFQLNFATGVNQTGTASYTLTTGDSIGITIIPNQVLRNFYVWENISLSYNFFYQNCTGQSVSLLTDQAIIQWEQVSPVLASLNLGIKSSAPSIQGIYHTSINISPFRAVPGNIYQLSLLIYIISDSNINQTLLINVHYVQSPIKGIILGGQNIKQYFNDELFMNCIVVDPDINYASQEPYYGITALWSCINSASNTICNDQFGQPLVTSQTTKNFTLPRGLLEIFNTYIFTLTLTSGARTFTTSVSVFVQNVDNPSIKVYSPLSQYFRQVNLNDLLYFSILNWNTTTQNPNKLIFTAQIFYNYVQVASFPFQYNQLRFKLMDYFTSISYTDQIHIQISLRDPETTNDNTTVVALSLNFPTLGCTLQVNPSTIKAMQQVTISVTNCIDQYMPLLYQYHIYWSQSDYNQENLYPTKIKRVLLKEFSLQNSFKTIMPQGNYTNNFQYLIMVSVKNQNGNIKNLTSQITVTESNLQIASYTSLLSSNLQSAQNQILQNKIQILAILASEASNQQKNIIYADPSFLQVKQNLVSQLFYCLTQVPPTNNQDLSISSSIKSLTTINFLINIPQNQLISIKANLTQFQTSVINKLQTIPLLFQTIDQAEKAAKYQGQLQDILQMYDQLLYSNNLMPANRLLGRRRRRDLGQSDTFNSDTMTQINNLAQAMLLNTLPNDPAKTFNGSAFTLSVQKITDQNIVNYLGSQNQLSISAPSLTSQNIYDVVNGVYNVNPYIFSSTFSYPAQSNSFQYLDIRISGSATPISLGGQNYVFNFTYNKTSTLTDVLITEIVTCISYVQTTQIWVNTICSTIFSTSPSDINKYIITCSCNQLAMTTIVEDVNYKFLISPADRPNNSKPPFEKAGELALVETPLLWYKFMPFWIWVLLTAFYLYFSNILYYRDKKQEKIFDLEQLKLQVPMNGKERNSIVSPGDSQNTQSGKSTALKSQRHRDQISPFSQRLDVKQEIKPKNLVTFRDFQPEINQLKEIKEEDELSKDESNVPFQENRSQYSSVNKNSKDNSPDKPNIIDIENNSSLIINKSENIKQQQQIQEQIQIQEQDIEVEQKDNLNAENLEDQKEDAVMQDGEISPNDNQNIQNNAEGNIDMNNEGNEFMEQDLQQYTLQGEDGQNIPQTTKNNEGIDIKTTNFQNEDDQLVQQGQTSQKLQEIEQQITSELNPQKISLLLKEKEKEKLKILEEEEYQNKFSQVQERSRKIEFSTGLQIFHIYSEPYHIYDKIISRMIRTSLLYLRLNVILLLTAYMNTTYSQISIIIVCTAVCCVLHIPMEIIMFLLRYIVTKMFGYLIILFSFAFILQQVLFMVAAISANNLSLVFKLTTKKIFLEQSDSWTVSFAISIGIEIFIINTLLAVFRYLTFRVSLRNNNLFSKILYKLIDGQKLLTFKEKK